MANIHKHYDNTSLSVKILGNFNFEDNHNFREVHSAVDGGNISQIDVDVSGVEMVDSAALGMLMMLRKKCEKHSVVLRLLQPRGQVKKMFELSKFYTIFTIVD